MMDVLFWTVLALTMLINAAGVLLVVLQLPGTWLIALVAALLTWWRPDRVPWAFPVILVTIALLGEVIELSASARGSRKAGGSHRGTVCGLAASLIGAVLGSFALPPVGTLIGACVGAGLGSYLGDRWAGRPHGRAVLAGRGAAAGRFWGTVLKLVLAVAMWLVAAFAAGRAVLAAAGVG